MNEHVQKTLNELELKIARLSDLKVALTAEFGEGDTAALEPQVRPAKRSKKPILAGGRKLGKNGRASGVDPRSLPNLRSVADLEEPFGPKDIGKSLGLRNPHGLLANYTARGWLERTEEGHRRTARFPKLADENNKATATKNGADIERQIRETCAARDNARARGNTALERILNDKIAQLERELATSA